jgi:phosphoglycolate phosphatase-like HAD superfamily hydrolase
VVIGDAESDMLAGCAIGARAFHVGPPPLPPLLDVAREIVSGTIS